MANNPYYLVRSDLHPPHDYSEEPEPIAGTDLHLVIRCDTLDDALKLRMIIENMVIGND